MVYSRSFVVNGFYAMVPFADMLNHNVRSGSINIEEKQEEPARSSRTESDNGSRQRNQKGWAAVAGWSKRVGPSGLQQGGDVCWSYQQSGAALVDMLNTFGFVTEVRTILSYAFCFICHGPILSVDLHNRTASMVCGSG
jgi:hypothetical protein